MRELTDAEAVQAFLDEAPFGIHTFDANGTPVGHLQVENDTGLYDEMWTDLVLETMTRKITGEIDGDIVYIGTKATARVVGGKPGEPVPATEVISIAVMTDSAAWSKIIGKTPTDWENLNVIMPEMVNEWVEMSHEERASSHIVRCATVALTLIAQ